MVGDLGGGGGGAKKKKGKPPFMGGGGSNIGGGHEIGGVSRWGEWGVGLGVFWGFCCHPKSEKKTMVGAGKKGVE